jgi:hypothetical protein
MAPPLCPASVITRRTTSAAPQSVNCSLPRTTQVALKVYSPAGRIAATLVNDRQRAGRNVMSWDVSRVPHSVVLNGVHLSRVEAGEFTATRKMVKTD